MKFLRFTLCGLLLALSVSSARAAGDEAVEAQIRSFYQYYIPMREASEDTVLLKKHRKEMSRYVTAGRLAKIARIPADSQEGDYFVKSLDSDPDWVKNLAISHIKIDAKGRATAEVLLTAKATGKIPLKLSLVLEGGTYKIDAVENLPYYGDMAAAQLRMFYAQYLHYLAHVGADGPPMERQDVRDGFTKDGLAKASAKGADGAKVDYLLQSTDWDPEWEEHIEVKPLEFATGDTHGTVEVLLPGEKIPKVRLKVSLKEENGAYKIAGVEKLGD